MYILITAMVIKVYAIKWGTNLNSYGG